MARQLKERPYKTLEFESWQSGLTQVLHRPVEIATLCGQSRHFALTEISLFECQLKPDLRHLQRKIELLLESLKSLRSRILEDFCAAMEFKAFTDLAYIFGAKYSSQPESTEKIILGHSEYAGEFGLSDQEVNISELPKFFDRAKESYLFSFVHQHQVSLFENIFFDLLRLILQDQPLHMSGKRQIDYITILKAETKDEIGWQMIERDLNELKYKSVSQWFAYLQNLVSIPDVSKDDLDSIAEAKAARDLLVHNAGIVNQIYMQKAGERARSALGEEIDIKGHYTRDTWTVFVRVLLDITDHLIQEFGSKQNGS